MQTPTLSRPQRRSTLSAKKTKSKETIKNIVATPYKNSYWPRISNEDHETLKAILQNNLPRVKPKKFNVPWKVLKNIPKPDRKKFRNEYTHSDAAQINEKDGDGLTFGINDVTKLLENNLVSAILVSSDIQPRIMVQHVIDAAILYRVPIIVFDDLRNLLTEFCGISAAVISISRNINPESKLHIIKESIEQIFEKYPPPLKHLNYERSLQNISTDQISPLTVNPSDNSKHIGLEKDNLLESEILVDNEIKDNLTESGAGIDTEVELTIYLKRESTNKRVFVPESSQKNVNICRMEVDSTGFLPFSDSSTQKIEKKIVRTTNYKSLIVKRLKGDPARNKKKIASLKRKLK